MSSYIYKFKTSLGKVRVLFDPTTFKPQLVCGRWLDEREVDCIKDFIWIEGWELIKKLYDFNNDRVLIVRNSDGSLWLEIELRDSFEVPRWLRTRRKKNTAVIALLDKWLSDDSGYDEATWPVLKEAIECSRTSARRRFSD